MLRFSTSTHIIMARHSLIRQMNFKLSHRQLEAPLDLFCCNIDPYEKLVNVRPSRDHFEFAISRYEANNLYQTFVLVTVIRALEEATL